VVGHNAFTRAQGIDVDTLGPEEWIVRTVDNTLIISGGRPRGVLYAAYRFLEQEVGIHWWNPWEDDVPAKPDLSVGSLALQGEPVLKYRDIYMLYGNDNGRFAARNRLNRDGDRRIGKEYGGCRDYGPPYHVHTFYKYIPPAQYYDEHPEYFSLIDGKRVADRHQLCLSNPEVRALFKRKLRAYIAQAEARAAEEGVPAPVVYDISQNDWHGQCQCGACQAIVKREGSEAGLMLDFVNEIAASIRESHPGVYIDTLAYQYTQEPPRHIKAADNVIVRLCDTRSNFTFPITHETNRDFHDFVQEWAQVAKNLRIWDYAVTYAQPRGLPFPSADTYAADYRFYSENNVEGVFTEHEYPILADVRDYKVWLMMKTLEDPYADWEALARTFAEGFYGAAGDVFLEYRALLRSSQDRHQAYISMGAGPGAFSFMDLDTTLAAQALFDRGSALVSSDSVLARRWRHARLSLDRATYARFRELVGQWRARGHAPEAFPLDRTAVAARVRRTWEEQIDMRIAESGQAAERRKMESELTRYTSLPAFVPLPEKFRDVPRERVFDFTADMSRNWRDIVKVVKDPEADSGITNRLEFPNSGGDKHALEKYKLPMPWGLYSPKEKTFVTSSSIEPDDVPGPGYHWYKMGAFPIGPSYYVYFFWSWIIQIDIDSAYDPEHPDRPVEIWAHIKFEGPAFPHGKAEDANAICVERLVLVRE
jgi:hypothetical protein